MHLCNTPIHKQKEKKELVLNLAEVLPAEKTESFESSMVNIYHSDSLSLYNEWPTPTAIVSDGAYGVEGFEGDTRGVKALPEWYSPHIAAWSKFSAPYTTLWFWNTERGWATVHPILEKHGWEYVACNVWNKGKGHVAGNANSKTLRRFPVVTEVCVQYVRDVRIDNKTLQFWLIDEWKRSGLPFYKANEACGVKNAATRKYLTKCHLWYFPPPEAFARMSNFANEHGMPEGKPYFSLDGNSPLTANQWELMRSKFSCPYGITNVWDHPPLRNGERVKNGSKALHLNQKPLALMDTIIEASTNQGDVIWEPFGGLFSASISAKNLSRVAYSGEINQKVYRFGLHRVQQAVQSLQLL